MEDQELGGEIEVTRKNFQAFAGAIRAILELEGPDADDKDIRQGPTGTTVSCVTDACKPCPAVGDNGVIPIGTGEKCE